tara:strand:+ start:311 stop:499 length:189 start_codon:yes stop_codon:yes gene_type:complete
MNKVFKIYDIQNKKVLLWDIKQMLEEINRDRTEEWEPYTEKDYIEGWNMWVEGEFYECRGIK